MNVTGTDAASGSGSKTGSTMGSVKKEKQQESWFDTAWKAVQGVFSGESSLDRQAREKGLSTRGFTSVKDYQDTMAKERREAAGLPAERQKTGQELAQAFVQKQTSAQLAAAKRAWQQQQQREAALKRQRELEKATPQEPELDNNGLHFVTRTQYVEDVMNQKNPNYVDPAERKKKPDPLPDRDPVDAKQETVAQWRENYYAENEKAKEWDAYLREYGLGGYYSEEHFKDYMDYLMTHRTAYEFAKLNKKSPRVAYDSNDPLRGEAEKLKQEADDCQRKLMYWDASDRQGYAASAGERNAVFQQLQAARQHESEIPIVLTKDTLSNPCAAKFADLLSIRGTYRGDQQKEYNRARAYLDAVMSNNSGWYTREEMDMASEVSAALTAKVPGVAIAHKFMEEVSGGLFELAAEQSRRNENDPSRDQLHYLQSAEYSMSTNEDLVAVVGIASTCYSLLTGSGQGAEVKAIMQMPTGIGEKLGRVLCFTAENYGKEIIGQIAETAMNERED